MRAGDVAFAAGTVLGAAQIGAAAAAGVPVIECAPRPRVAVVPTGSELRSPGDSLSPGQIYESNAALLVVLCESAGAEVVRFDPVADDEEATRAALAKALEADVLVTTGGVSVGVKDLVRGVLAELGAEEVFWRVAVRPGKPVAFAVRGETLLFGLPGNPVSSLVAFELFVRPALRALQGAEPGPFYLPGRLAGTMSRNESRDDLVRATLRADEEAVWLAAAVRAVVPHDRARGRCGRARSHSARRGRARPRLARALPGSLSRPPAARLRPGAVRG